MQNPSERKRLAALESYQILDTPSEPAFDRLTSLAARLLRVPTVLVTLVDADRQWVKSHYGPAQAAVPREVSFCAHTVAAKRLLVVEDTILDPRFADNPMVVGAPNVRFYAGAPLLTPEGEALGSLCVADFQPRAFSPEEAQILTELAASVSTELELRRATLQARQTEENYRLLFEANPQPMWVFDPGTLRLLAVNQTAVVRYGYTRDEFLGMTVADFRPAEDAAALRQFLSAPPASLPVRQSGPWRHRRKDGGLLWTQVSAQEVAFEGQAARLVVATDVTEQVAAEEALRREQEFLRLVLDTSPSFVFVKDEQDRFILANRAMAGLYGTTPDRLVGRASDELTPDRDRAAFCTQMNRRVRETQQSLTLPEEEFPDADGRPRWFQTVRTPLTVDAGHARQVLGIGVDITERRQAEVALRESEQRLSLIYDTVSDLLFLIQVEGEGRYRCVSVNASYLAVTKMSRDQVVGQYVEEIVSESEAAYVREKYAEALTTRKTIVYPEEVNLPGGRLIVQTTLTPIFDAQGNGTYLLGSARDVTEQAALEAERERALKEARDQADRDALTGLLNHRAFHKRFGETLQAARGAGAPPAVVLLDLDNFKFFNDAYGHIAGDSVLRRVAQIVQGELGEDSALARFGGDEFALLVPRDQAEAVVRKIKRAVDAVEYRPPGYENPVPLSVSAGVALFPEDGRTRLPLLEVAEARLLRAKSGDEDDGRAERLRAFMSSSIEGFSMLDALVTAVDNKDRYTRRHSEDVLSHSLQIAEQLGWNQKQQHAVAVAALLHDVGKIGVPDSVLRKPGKLTDGEFDAVRQHPMMGAIIVGAVPGFETTLDAVRHHHERWDGGGYPFGLRGEETPEMARLMAVADAYSAMTMDRPYRKGLAPEEALRRLRDGAGTQWDPQCVEAFLRARRRPS